MFIYEQRNVSKNMSNQTPKIINQIGNLSSGKLFRNGIFAKAFDNYKAGGKAAERIRVYKKLKPSIWTYNYEFSILYYWIEESGCRECIQVPPNACN